VAGVIRALLGWLSGASASATLAFAVLAVGVLVLGLLYRRYLRILGADPSKPGERQAYDALWSSLAKGNTAVSLYAERLTQLLNWMDRFFGDAGLAGGTLFPYAFGLKKPVPLWTAPALDRCLLLSLVYPVIVIILIWAFSGHVGPAEQALHLASNAPGWTRVGAVGSLGFMLFASWRLQPWSTLPGLLLYVLAAVVAAVLFGAGAFVGAGAASFVYLLVIGVLAVGFVPGGAVAFAFCFFGVVGLASEGPATVTNSLAGAGSFVFAMVVQKTSASVRHQRQGALLRAWPVSWLRACDHRCQTGR
jgi:hypothetical protein